MSETFSADMFHLFLTSWQSGKINCLCTTMPLQCQFFVTLGTVISRLLFSHPLSIVLFFSVSFSFHLYRFYVSPCLCTISSCLHIFSFSTFVPPSQSVAPGAVRIQLHLRYLPLIFCLMLDTCFEVSFSLSPCLFCFLGK